MSCTQGIPAALIDSIFGNFKDRLQNIDRDQKAYDDVRPLIYSLSHYHEHPLEARLRESVIHCLREIFQAVVKVKGECKGCIEIHSELDKTSDRTNESIVSKISTIHCSRIPSQNLSLICYL